MARGSELSLETARRESEDVKTEAGIAEHLLLEFTPGEPLHWVLTYCTKEGEIKEVEGRGPDEVVDFGIRMDDRIAFYMHNGIFPIWMRSDDLTLTPSDVMREYRRVAERPFR